MYYFDKYLFLYLFLYLIALYYNYIINIGENNEQKNKLNKIDSASKIKIFI